MISLDLPGTAYVDYQHSHATAEMQVEDEGELEAYTRKGLRVIVSGERRLS